MSDDGKQLLLLAGIAAGFGGALILRRRKRRAEAPTPAPAPPPQADWSTTSRIAAAAVGGGLLLYGTRTPGKWGRVATTTGAGLLLRSINDEPVRKFTDVVQPRMLLVG